MIGFKWHIVTACLLLCLASGGFSQSPDSRDVSVTLRATDAIMFTQQKSLDSLLKSTEQEYASLKQTHDSVASASSMAVLRASARIDSLATLGLETGHLTKRLDSIMTSGVARLDSIAGRVGALQARVDEKLRRLDLPPQVMEETKSWTSKLGQLQQPLDMKHLQGVTEKIDPSLNLPEVGAPSIPDTDLPSLENPISAQALPGMPEVPDLNFSTGDIGELADPLAPIEQQVADVVPAVPAGAAEVTTVLEERAASLPAATGVTEQLDAGEGLNPLIASAGDPEAAKEKLIEDTRKVAVNHFAGKEEELQQAMDKLAALKKKYGSIESVANLPKKVPNPMSSKPFVDRLVPGLALQVGRNVHWLLDVNLYMGYRITTRLTAGLGWNQRVTYSVDANSFSSHSVIYGPRVYGEYGIGKGFSSRLELEYMNTHVPAAFSSNPDNPDGREWVFGAMAGMKKTYTITRRLKGTVLLMYNLYDPYHRSPYSNRLNGRFGVEWRIQKQSTIHSENEN